MGVPNHLLKTVNISRVWNMRPDNVHVGRVRLCLWTAATNGSIFITKVMHEHGESWWNDTGRGKLLIRLPELSSKPTSSHHLAQKAGGTGQKRSWIWVYEVSLFILPKSYDMGPTALLPLRRKVCCGLKSPSVETEPAIVLVQWQARKQSHRRRHETWEHTYYSSVKIYLEYL
jgi:hypothetical protein